MTALKTIRIKEETFQKFRKYGVRTQTDDNIMEALIELAERCLFKSDYLFHRDSKINQVRDIEGVLIGNRKSLKL